MRSTEVLDPAYVGRMSLPMSSITANNCEYLLLDAGDATAAEDGFIGTALPPTIGILPAATEDDTFLGADKSSISAMSEEGAGIKD